MELLFLNSHTMSSILSLKLASLELSVGSEREQFFSINKASGFSFSPETKRNLGFKTGMEWRTAVLDILIHPIPLV